MAMSYYPFDTQACTAEIEIANGGQFIELFTDKMNYTGASDVMEYVVTETIYYKKNDQVIFKITLGRRLLSVILTTMIPTIIIIIVALSTNYYNYEQHFKTIIPVNLTSLLLMVTMFIGVKAKLPQTSSLKFIDLWLVFTLIILFINVILHGYLDYLRLKEKGKKKNLIYSNH